MAIDIQRVAQAIREIESGDKGVTALGDSGCALGQFQFHPEAFYDWCTRPRPGETWEDWFQDTIEHFIDAMANTFLDIQPDEIAVVFHQHCYIRRASLADWSKDDYAMRFRKAYGLHP